MKKSIIIFLLTIITISVWAQESTKQKEFGLTFYNLNSFGITYRTGTGSAMWRFSTVFIGGNNRDETFNDIRIKNSNGGAGFAVGREFRKALSEHFELRYGADLALSYNASKTQRDFINSGNQEIVKQNTLNPGVDFIIGLNYLIGKNFVIGAELLPYFRYTTGKSKVIINGDVFNESDITGTSFGLSNTSVLLSLVYRF